MEKTARTNWHQIGFTDQREAAQEGQPFFLPHQQARCHRRAAKCVKSLLFHGLKVNIRVAKWNPSIISRVCLNKCIRKQFF